MRASNTHSGYPIGLEWEHLPEAHTHPPKSRPLSGATHTYYRRPTDQVVGSSRHPPHLAGSERRIANPPLWGQPLS